MGSRDAKTVPTGKSQVRGREGSNTSSKSTVSLAVLAISEQAGPTQLGQRTSKALVLFGANVPFKHYTCEICTVFAEETEQL